VAADRSNTPGPGVGHRRHRAAGPALRPAAPGRPARGPADAGNGSGPLWYTVSSDTWTGNDEGV